MFTKATHFIRRACRTCVVCCLCIASTPYVKAQVYCGVETDPLPFVLGGYIVSAYAGSEQWHLRVLDVQVHKPDFLLSKGFDENRIHSNAVLVDYLPKGAMHQEWWFSVGAVFWRGEIRHVATAERKNYSSQLLSFDVGYFWFLDSHFYLSPWAALHVRVAGDSELPFSTQVYTIPRFNPEASLKLGYTFTL